MLRVQAGHPDIGPVTSEVAISHSRTTQAVREHNQWRRSVGAGQLWQVQASRNRPLPVGIDQLEIEDAMAWRG